MSSNSGNGTGNNERSSSFGSQNGGSTRTYYNAQSNNVPQNGGPNESNYAAKLQAQTLLLRDYVLRTGTHRKR